MSAEEKEKEGSRRKKKKRLEKEKGSKSSNREEDENKEEEERKEKVKKNWQVYTLKIDFVLSIWLKTTAWLQKFETSEWLIDKADIKVLPFMVETGCGQQSQDPAGQLHT